MGFRVYDIFKALPTQHVQVTLDSGTANEDSARLRSENGCTGVEELPYLNVAYDSVARRTSGGFTCDTLNRALPLGRTRAAS